MEHLGHLSTWQLHFGLFMSLSSFFNLSPIFYIHLLFDFAPLHLILWLKPQQMKSIKNHNFHLEISSLSQLLRRFYVRTGGVDIVLTFCILDADVRHEAFVVLPCNLIDQRQRHQALIFSQCGKMLVNISTRGEKGEIMWMNIDLQKKSRTAEEMLHSCFSISAKKVLFSSLLLIFSLSAGNLKTLMRNIHDR